MRADEQALRRFVRARDADDAAAATAAWCEVVELTHDRIRGFAETWSALHPGARLRPDELAEVVQRAHTDMWRRLGGTFAGTSMGELVNALRRLVGFRCADVVAEAVRRRRRESSLDALRAGDDGHAREAHPAEEREARRRAQLAEEREQAGATVAWGLEQMANDRRRTVLQRTLDGATAPEIAAELGVSIDNLHQLRSRGTRDLRSILEDHES